MALNNIQKDLLEKFIELVLNKSSSLKPEEARLVFDAVICQQFKPEHLNLLGKLGLLAFVNQLREVQGLLKSLAQYNDATKPATKEDVSNYIKHTCHMKIYECDFKLGRTSWDYFTGRGQAFGADRERFYLKFKDRIITIDTTPNFSREEDSWLGLIVISFGVQEKTDLDLIKRNLEKDQPKITKRVMSGEEQGSFLIALDELGSFRLGFRGKDPAIGELLNIINKYVFNNEIPLCLLNQLRFVTGQELLSYQENPKLQEVKPLALKFELILKDVIDAEELEYQLTLFLLLFKNTDLMKIVPAMDLIACYEATIKGAKIEILLSKYNYIPPLQFIQRFAVDFQLSVNSTLNNLDLKNYQYVRCFPGVSFNNQRDSQKKYISITKGNQKIEKELQQQPLINLPPNVPHHGFVMTLTNNHKQGDVSAKQLQEDVFALMEKLKNQSIVITIKNVRLQIRLFVLTEITGQSFTLAIPGIIMPPTQEDVFFLRNCCKDLFSKFEFMQKYFISQCGNSTDFTKSTAKEIRETLNSRIIDAIGVKDIPDEYCCALSGQIMDDPIKLSDADPYIEKRVFVIMYSHNPVNPFTQQYMEWPEKIPVDKTLKEKISLFVRTQVKACRLKEDFVEEKSATTEDVQSPFSKNPGNIKIKSPLTPGEDAHKGLMNRIKEFYREVGNTRPGEFKAFLEAVSKKNYPEALREACRKLESVGLVEILLSYKEQLPIGIDERDKDDYTAAFYAAMNKNKEAYNLLVENGANVALNDNKGISAEEYARENLKLEIIRP